MKEKSSIVVFGGSFNPPLNSHFAIAEQVLNQYKEVEKVILVPVNQNYPKKGLEKNKYRYNMLKMITDKNNKFLLSDIDMEGNKSLNTIEILRKVQKQFPDKQVSFIIGSDNLKELNTWKNSEELISNYKILVMERNNDKLEEIINQNELLKKYKENIKKINEEIRSNYNSCLLYTSDAADD